MAKPYNYNLPANVDGGSRSHARHGDIFTNQGHRHTKSVIALRDSSTGEIRFIKNPDDSGSGYLTIPAQILAPVTDAMAKYKILMTKPELAPAFNMHISTHDIWLVEKLGTNAIPEVQGWDFDLHYVNGQIQEVYVKPPNVRKAQPFLLPLYWTSIKEYFQYKTTPQGWFEVQVTLDEEALKRYRDKYSPNKKYGWLSTKPDMGPLWTVESGRCGVKSGNNFFTWKLDGPLKTMEQAVNKIEEWFEGFPYTMKKSTDKDPDDNTDPGDKENPDGNPPAGSGATGPDTSGSNQPGN